MKRSFAAVVLTAFLSVSTLAGEIPSGDFVSPPPPPPNGAQSQSSTTNAIQTDSTAEDLYNSFLVTLASLFIR